MMSFGAKKMSVSAAALVKSTAAHVTAAVHAMPASALAIGAVALPFALPSLREISDWAATVAPIFGLALVIVKIAVEVGGRRISTEHAEKVKDAAPAAAKAAASLGRRGLLAALGVGVGVLIAAVTWGMVARKPADPPAVARLVTAAPVGRKKRSDDDAGDRGDVDGGAASRHAPPWLLDAHADLGTREWKGKRHNPKILAYFADAGTPEIQDDETSWCAAFVGAHVARKGYAAPGDARARAFLNWGQPIETPDIGAVVVFWRESPQSWKGHVGFVWGVDGDDILVLGGNQGDAVSIARFHKSRVLGYRWPRGKAQLRTVRAGTAAAVTEGAGVGMQTTSAMIDQSLPPADKVADAVAAIQQPLREMSSILRWAGVAASVIGLVLALYVVYRRIADHKARGV